MRTEQHDVGIRSLSTVLLNSRVERSRFFKCQGLLKDFKRPPLFAPRIPMSLNLGKNCQDGGFFVAKNRGAKAGGRGGGRQKDGSKFKVTKSQTIVQNVRLS